MAKTLDEVRAEYRQAFERESGPITTASGRPFMIGSDMSAPYGVYINAECVADYGDDQDAAEQHYRLLVDVHRAAMGHAPRYIGVGSRL